MSKKIKIKTSGEDEKGQVEEVEYIIDTEKKKKELPSEVKELKANIKKRLSEIKNLKKENKKLKEEYIRKIAEMENLRKRLEREKSEFYQYALSNFLGELLAVLDNFERALESENKGDGKSFREGIEMIYKQYQNLLMKQGLTSIELNGKKFDPHHHQALMTEESEDVKEPEISEEIQKGYMLHNRLLRPTLVKVRVPKKG
ncbi:MAG: nucleotide exchange factor GrpE [Candidatus Aminicenantes bacterium]|nr:MAG: nucleotide exchange factor GrpE [Candidatus Aminicenantes bacterium]